MNKKIWISVLVVIFLFAVALVLGRGDSSNIVGPSNDETLLMNEEYETADTVKTQQTDALDPVAKDGEPDPVVQENPTPTNQNQEDTCSLISDSTFKSVGKYEAGNSPNGAVSGYWSVTFDKNRVSWNHSDVAESGTYTCKNDNISVKFYSHSITATYDSDKKVLIWEGIEYKRVQ